jgi:hypothetical protein
MDVEPLRRFVSLDLRKRELEAQVKEVAAELGEAREAAIDALLAAGLQEGGVDGRNVALVQHAGASPVHTKEDVIAALKASPLAGFVVENYNPNSLRAFADEVLGEVRDRANAEKWDRAYTVDDVRAALPEPLRDVLHISFYYTLSNTKGKAR